MALAHKYSHPRDRFIRFVETTHQYYYREEAPFPRLYRFPRSVTGTIAQRFPKFQPHAVVRQNLEKWLAQPHHKYASFLRVCQESHLTRDEIVTLFVKCWAAMGTEASSAGRQLHFQIETSLNHEGMHSPPRASSTPDRSTTSPPCNRLEHEIMRLDGPFQISSYELVRSITNPTTSPPSGVCRVLVTKEFEAWKEWRATTIAFLRPIRVEWSLYSISLGIAGQIDALFYDRSTRSYVLYDWKRVKKDLRAESESGDTSLHRYTIQLNIYAYLLRTYYDIDVTRCVLLQIVPPSLGDDPGDNPSQYVEIPVTMWTDSDTVLGFLNPAVPMEPENNWNFFS